MSRTRYRAVALLLVLLAAACTEPTRPAEASGDLAPVYLALGEAGVAGRWIVVLKPSPQDGGFITTAAADVAAAAHTRPDVVYGSGRGFAGSFGDGTLQQLRRDPRVAWIEQDQIVTVGSGWTQTITGGQPWGLDRLDQAALPLSGTFSYHQRAANVTVYVIDTGIRTTLSEFFWNGKSRAQDVFDYAGGSGDDCNGHGTHVAGTIGSTTYGVAKRVQLRGVRVLDCSGAGLVSQVVSGLDWVLQNHKSLSVANMSLSGGYSKTLNVWVDSLSAAGVFMVVSAGNDNADACALSPASALGAFTVAASDASDQPASFTNWGRCVDIYAPGVSIRSTWPSGTNTLSGTSMAAPHVAGLAALGKAIWGDLPSASIGRRILNRAVRDVIVSNDAGGFRYGTPNVLAQMGGGF